MRNRESEITVVEEDLEVDSNTKASVLKGVRFEALRIGLFVLAFLILLLFAIPYFFDNSALKFQLEQKISQSLQTKFTIYG